MERASVIVIGGGVLGTSVAYHLASMGQKDVLLLERKNLATASSSQAAGLMFQISSKPAVDQLSRRTFELLSELEGINDEALDFRSPGTLRIAENTDEKKNLSALYQRARNEGVSAEQVDEKWRSERLPWLKTSPDTLAVHFAGEGYIDPYRLTNAYAKAARHYGAKVKTGISVLSIEMSNGAISGVETDAGYISCDSVVVAGGSWSNQLTVPLGVSLPMIPTRSHFWIAAPDKDFGVDQPMVVHADAGAYTRPEVGGLLLGVQEAQSRTFDYRQLPEDILAFAVTEEGGEWDALVEAESRVSSFFPGLENARFESYMAGLSAYTPDGHFILGSAGDISGLYVAAGCCGSGVMASGGIGEALAEVIAKGHAKYDLNAFDPHRFGTVDTTSKEFQELCAKARARKSK
ncbi:MAG: FAD-binding oxidoreductase [Halopseudomonas aestusnigri]